MAGVSSSSDVTDLLEQFSLQEEDCNKEVSAAHVEDVSRRACSKWRSLPAPLEMEEIVVNDVDRERQQEQERRQLFLDKWKDLKGSKATYKKLISALLATERRKDAEYVCQLLCGSENEKSSENQKTVSHQASSTQGGKLLSGKAQMMFVNFSFLL